MAFKKIAESIAGIIWGKRLITVHFNGRTDDFVDTWLSEKHELEVISSQYPVEGGSTISDTAYVEPRKITLAGHISNLAYIPYTLSQVGFKSYQKIQDGWHFLEQAAQARELLRVSTTVGDFSNMLISKLTTTIDKETGVNLTFEIEFKETRIVSSYEGIQPVMVKGTPAENMTTPNHGGVVQPKPVSLLKSGLKYFKWILLNMSVP